MTTSTMPKDALKKEFEYYLANQEELVKKYNHRFIVITNKKVVGDYDSSEQAFYKSIEKGLQLGTFLIQECTAGEDAYTQAFHSRVTFA